MTFKSRVYTTLKVLGIAAATAFMVKTTTPKLYAQEMAEPSKPKVEAQAEVPAKGFCYRKFSVGAFGGWNEHSVPAEIKDVIPGPKLQFGATGKYSEKYKFLSNFALGWEAMLSLLYPSQRTIIELDLGGKTHTFDHGMEWFAKARAMATLALGSYSSPDSLFEGYVGGFYDRDLSKGLYHTGGAEIGVNGLLGDGFAEMHVAVGMQSTHIIGLSRLYADSDVIAGVLMFGVGFGVIKDLTNGDIAAGDFTFRFGMAFPARELLYPRLSFEMTSTDWLNGIYGTGRDGKVLGETTYRITSS
ncbi:MAG: hypothetical protein WCT31_03970, partial [Candidatus Micrarchaeia archaeon]